MIETIADIVREIREGFNQSWRDVDREWAHDLADRIEAAWKRETQKPRRNCDVGTGEEQTLRFHDFCESHRVPFDHSRGTMCAGAQCPAYNNDANCFFMWAQLPYQEEGAEGTES